MHITNRHPKGDKSEGLIWRFRSFCFVDFNSLADLPEKFVFVDRTWAGNIQELSRIHLEVGSDLKSVSKSQFRVSKLAFPTHESGNTKRPSLLRACESGNTEEPTILRNPASRNAEEQTLEAMYFWHIWARTLGTLGLPAYLGEELGTRRLPAHSCDDLGTRGLLDLLGQNFGTRSFVLPR